MTLQSPYTTQHISNQGVDVFLDGNIWRVHSSQITKMTSAWCKKKSLPNLDPQVGKQITSVLPTNSFSSLSLSPHQIGNIVRNPTVTYTSSGICKPCENERPHTWAFFPSGQHARNEWMNGWMNYLFIFLSFWACVVDDNFDDHGFNHDRMAWGGTRSVKGKKAFVIIFPYQIFKLLKRCRTPCKAACTRSSGHLWWHIETMGVRFYHVLVENNLGFRLVVEGNNILLLLSSIKWTSEPSIIDFHITTFKTY